jgi:phosphate transport system permease protein
MSESEINPMSEQSVQSTEDGELSVLQQAADRLALRRKIRHIKDKTAHWAISFGGISVIFTILLIFAYLFYEVVPLFESAEINEVASYSLNQSADSSTLHLAIEEQSEIAMHLSDVGLVTFFQFGSGEVIQQTQIPLPADSTISSFAIDTEASGVMALGLSNGQVQVVAHDYEVSYRQSDNARIITPLINYPFGTAPYSLFAQSDAGGRAVGNKGVIGVALRSRGENLTLAGIDAQGGIQLLEASKQTSLFAAFDDDAGSSFDVELAPALVNAPEASSLQIDGDRRWLLAIADNGLVRVADIAAILDGEFDSFDIELFVTDNGLQPTSIRFLLGGISLLVADESGGIGQWFVSRQGDQIDLSKVRTFEPSEFAVNTITVEQRQKNFISADQQGTISIYNTTANRAVFQDALVSGTVSAMAISPRGDALLLETGPGQFVAWDVHNEHPEVSMSALWEQVWYEGYAEPEYIWQSSAATNEFEPKYSLVPLSFGTLKAAFYAMLLAAPLAICGAIFTGYFMAPTMRGKVKPLIELMEALPTVVLGFLAGLWLAPFVEQNLLGIFSILIVLPLSILAASLGWMYLPKRIRHAVPDGWEAAILIPVIIVFGFLSFVVAGPLEVLLFEGDLRFWITNELGVTYDQRNAMVVGFAMGFAVIPTVFSIAEDAIFTVPRHLSYGSLALGATPWQSLCRVVLPTASPGIFSGLMIGLGRAVGETMIVLMATGNTPIMDINLFEGMRTLAANIAVEIPESEVDSTHYRILFLAALVLFSFTFVINTIAEIVRQRLRGKYSTI